MFKQKLIWICSETEDTRVAYKKRTRYIFFDRTLDDQALHSPNFPVIRCLPRFHQKRKRMLRMHIQPERSRATRFTMEKKKNHFTPTDPLLYSVTVHSSSSVYLEANTQSFHAEGRLDGPSVRLHRFNGIPKKWWAFDEAGEGEKKECFVIYGPLWSQTAPSRRRWGA